MYNLHFQRHISKVHYYKSLPSIHINSVESKDSKKRNEICIILETLHSKSGLNIIKYTEAVKKKHVKIFQKDYVLKSTEAILKCQVIILEKFERFSSKAISDTCEKHNISVIGFITSQKSKTAVYNFPIKFYGNVSLRDYQITSASNMFRVLKTEQTDKGIIPLTNWVVFSTNHSTFLPLATAKVIFGGKNKHISKCVVLFDKGQLDGVRKIVFGNTLQYWLHIPMFLEAISFFTEQYWSLKRYILVDIDDIFVGKSGMRLKESDVEV